MASSPSENSVASSTPPAAPAEQLIRQFLQQNCGQFGPGIQQQPHFPPFGPNIFSDPPKPPAMHHPQLPIPSATATTTTNPVNFMAQQLQLFDVLAKAQAQLLLARGQQQLQHQNNLNNMANNMATGRPEGTSPQGTMPQGISPPAQLTPPTNGLTQNGLGLLDPKIFGSGAFGAPPPLALSSADALVPQASRKRRRARTDAACNPDNTLDGLVAKRATCTGGSGNGNGGGCTTEEREALKRRYQTETEAIELPDDDEEIKRMEADPDVCTRMCSVCGYQGKWVSEMIRHKRVHTNERPFKCKYCNRTSKWKADLIRHVAKTHGIRVVSKYSRSKAFELGKQHQHQQQQQEMNHQQRHVHLPDDEEDEADHDQTDQDDVIVLAAESDNDTFSLASNESDGPGQPRDENNNTHHRREKNGTSLNSQLRKAQRLSSIASRSAHIVQRQLFAQQIAHNQQKAPIEANKQRDLVLALDLMGSTVGGTGFATPTPASMAPPTSGATTTTTENGTTVIRKAQSDAAAQQQLALLQFLQLFPKLFPSFQQQQFCGGQMA